MSHGHGEAQHIEFPLDPEFGKATPGKIGMWIFLVTDAMSFAGLLLAYAVLRANTTTDWPNPVEALGGVELSGFMTFLLICSSVSMVLCIDYCRRQNKKLQQKWLLITIMGGLGFLALQVYEYNHLVHGLGMTFDSYAHGNNLFSSTFYAITGFHGLHVFTGTMYLIYMYVLGNRGDFDNGNYNQLEIAGLFWHFVDLVWILVFTFVYLI
jgi:cytochrome c oxidase subunit 3